MHWRTILCDQHFGSISLNWLLSARWIGNLLLGIRWPMAFWFKQFSLPDTILKWIPDHRITIEIQIELEYFYRFSATTKIKINPKNTNRFEHETDDIKMTHFVISSFEWYPDALIYYVNGWKCSLVNRYIDIFGTSMYGLCLKDDSHCVCNFHEMIILETLTQKFVCTRV